MKFPNIEESKLTFHAEDGTEIFVRKWSPEAVNDIKAVVQVAHGLMEHSARYTGFAVALAQAGYVVYANDHRGHGHTAKTMDEIGCVGEDGLNWMVKDMAQLTRLIQSQHKNSPVFMFGHSMGSFLAQKYMGYYGNEVQGVILSGTSGKMGPIVNVGIWLARREMRIKGVNWRSQKLHRVSFGGYNKQFKPRETEFDWLTRDRAEIQKYMDDPLCGTIFSSQFFYEFALFLKGLHSKDSMAAIPHHLPVYIFAGDKDPVSKSGKGIHQLVQWYQAVGMNHVTVKLYPSGRHEMLNEVNRDEVIGDIISWLDVQTSVADPFSEMTEGRSERRL